MDRVYGAFKCQGCERIPSVGFIYFCQQDLVFGSLTHLASPLAMHKATRNKLKKINQESHGQASSAAAQLEMLGFNKSIVKAAEEGHYSAGQIAILKSQKLKVKQTILQSVEQREILRSKAGPSPAVLSDKLGALTSPPMDPSKLSTNSDGDVTKEPAVTPNSSPESKTKWKWTKPNHQASPANAALLKAFQACEFRVCHTCRPHFRDRCFTSFEAVYNGEISPLVSRIPELMPVAPVDIMKTIGLREPATPEAFHLVSKTSLDLNYDLDAAFSDLSAKGNSTKGLDRSPGDNRDYDIESQLQVEELDQLSDLKSHSGTNSRIKPQASSVGFRETLAKDMREIIERASHDARNAYSRKGDMSTQDEMTGLDSKILEKLKALYRRGGKEIFDLDLWKALTDAIQERAAQTPLPGEDGDDDLEPHSVRINGLGIIIDESGPLSEEGSIGLALTEEAAENRSPDIITSI